MAKPTTQYCYILTTKGFITVEENVNHCGAFKLFELAQAKSYVANSYPEDKAVIIPTTAKTHNESVDTLIKLLTKNKVK